MMAYSIAYGKVEEYAEAIKLGLSRLPNNFVARPCGVCDGLGEYRQMYTAGCGGRDFMSTGGCDRCKATGLMQGNNPAPDSVINQILIAAGRDDLATAIL